jgi:hypothetical protein
MCIKDYETVIGGQGPLRAVELLKKNNRPVVAAVPKVPPHKLKRKK